MALGRAPRWELVSAQASVSSWGEGLAGRLDGGSAPRWALARALAWGPGWAKGSVGVSVRGSGLGSASGKALQRALGSVRCWAPLRAEGSASASGEDWEPHSDLDWAQDSAYWKVLRSATEKGDRWARDLGLL